MTSKGKFIVIEGTDGSGKTTQLELLNLHLQANAINTHILDFPQYGQFWGKMVGRFLSGEFGELDDIPPYLIQPYYMLDQATQNEVIRRKREAGTTVLSNRYITSSMAHQTSKLPESEQEAFLNWLMDAGYDQLKMPKPDLVIVLYVPPEISMELSKKARKRKQSYADGKEIAEDHFEHQQKSAAQYRKLCKKFPEWKLIECTNENGELLSIEAIHAKVLKILA